MVFQNEEISTNLSAKTWQHTDLKESQPYRRNTCSGRKEKNLGKKLIILTCCQGPSGTRHIQLPVKLKYLIFSKTKQMWTNRVWRQGSLTGTRHMRLPVKLKYLIYSKTDGDQQRVETGVFNRSGATCLPSCLQSIQQTYMVTHLEYGINLTLYYLLSVLFIL